MVKPLRCLMLVMVLSLLVAAWGLAAQQPPAKVPYATGKIIWTWVRGTTPSNNGEADQLRVKCGSVSGQYTLQVKAIQIPTPPASPPDYAINIRDAVPGPGIWYCVATAAKGTNESSPSVEIPFDATDAVIAAPVNPRLM